MVKDLPPEKVQLFNQISLSHQTVTRKINNISHEICEMLYPKKYQIKEF